MKKEKNKKKFQEGKLYKYFRRLTSLGLAGALAVMFPNEIVAWLSAGAGALYGKGIIGFGLMSTIVTFLGSAAGLFVQKVILCGLTYIFSNVILKQGKRLFNYVKTKFRSIFPKRRRHIVEVKKETSVPVKKIEEPKIEKKPEMEKKIETASPVSEVKPKIKTLGVHPSMKK